MENGSYWLDKVRTSIWRDVRTLAIEEAYTTKYSIHPGADTMLCGFRLTNRWLSMKKDIASCGSKYLAYSEEEVEYQGSSGLLLQPELWVVEGLTLERYSTFGKKDKLEPMLMPRVVKSRDEIFSRWGYCDNHDLSRRDRLIGIGFVKFISFTFGDKNNDVVIGSGFASNCIIREVFVKLLLDSFGKLSISLLEVTAAKVCVTAAKLKLVLFKDMDSDTAHIVAASKVPMLKPENGNTTQKTTVVKGVEKVIPPTIAKEKAQKRLEVKAISTLMMGIPNKHQLKFNSIKDAKLLLEAIENRLQKLVSQLEILGETISQEDVNQKLLRSLSPEWNTHAIVWRNKPELETMSMDDLYNNLKIYETEVKGTSSSNTSTQNIAFVSSNNSRSTNKAVNTSHRVSSVSTQVSVANSTNVDNLSDAVICALFFSQPNNPQLANEDLQQLHPDDLKEMDLRCQMAMLTMRARRFLKNTRRRITVNSNESIELQETKTTGIGKLKKKCASRDNYFHALISCDGLGGYDWSD
ncbi:hypothetical protein Tco_0382829 [Tanacetum coccineum]